MKYSNIFILLISLFSSLLSTAQLTIELELRPRTEFRYGYRIPANSDVKPALFISQRSRLTFAYTNDKLIVKTSFQDVRVWGDEIQNIDNPSMGLHEAYAQIQLKKNIFLTAGRQELVYDDHRLLGNSDWTQTAKSHDALLFKFKNEKWLVDAAIAYNQLSENNFAAVYTTGNYQTLLIGRAEAYIKKWKISFINIADAYQINDTTLDIGWRNTAGPSIIYDNKKIEATGRFYIQNAKIEPTAKGFAYMINTKLKLMASKYNLWVGYDHLSGCNNYSNSAQCFNTLYATNHKFYGTMDYYLNIPKDTRNSGLKDIYLGAQFILGPKSIIQIDLHEFFLTNNVIVDGLELTTFDKNLGFEADFAFTFKIMDAVKLTAGQSIYLPTTTTAFIKSIENERTSFWTYVGLNVTSQLFQSK